MGWHAGRKLRTAVANLRRILAIEMMTAARAIDLRAPLTPGAEISSIISALRETVAGPGPDRFLAPDIEMTESFIRNLLFSPLNTAQ